MFFIMMVIVHTMKLTITFLLTVHFCVYILFSIQNQLIFTWKQKWPQALAGMAQLVGHCSVNQRVMRSIPGRGMCLGCRFSPSGGVWKAACGSFSLTLMLLAFSSSLFSPPSKITKKNLVQKASVAFWLPQCIVFISLFFRSNRITEKSKSLIH